MNANPAAMSNPLHRSAEALEAGAAALADSPKSASVLDLIVRRPAVDAREVVREARLDVVAGLEGDDWLRRGSSRAVDGSANPEMQITLMNSRVIALIAGDPERWALAGDQLFADLDLSAANLPAGTRLRVGEAVIEITAEPHTGCAKFKARYGAAALAFVNSPAGREQRRRGVNARVVTGGIIRAGDPVVKL
jgi:hypothetical protein